MLPCVALTLILLPIRLYLLFLLFDYSHLMSVSAIESLEREECGGNPKTRKEATEEKLLYHVLIWGEGGTGLWGVQLSAKYGRLQRIIATIAPATPFRTSQRFCNRSGCLHVWLDGNNDQPRKCPVLFMPILTFQDNLNAAVKG